MPNTKIRKKGIRQRAITMRGSGACPQPGQTDAGHKGNPAIDMRCDNQVRYQIHG